MKLSTINYFLMVLSGLALYYLMITGTESVVNRLFIAEVGSLAIFWGGTSLLKLLEE